MADQIAAARNVTGKFVPTTEGLVFAYSNIMLMALIPIFFGSFKSVKHQTETHAKCQETGEQADIMTTKDAIIFPLIASCALFGLFIFIKLCPQLVNMLVSAYFSILGLLAIYRLLKPVTAMVFPKRFNSTEYNFLFSSQNTSGNTLNETRTTEDSSDGNESPASMDSANSNQAVMISIKFTSSDILAFVLATTIGAWYIYYKHWVANNVFGLAFALNGIELLPVNSFKIGCVLLCGLFFYDVFWVFGTDVMVSVAKDFEAPIKLLFPQDFLIRGFWGKHYAMLGLGDIVIPGIFIAFLLRFDHSLKRDRNIYFWSCFLAYITGLGFTVFVMKYFDHAQPALLYLVPACTLIPLVTALIKGDFKALLHYRDHPQLEDEAASDSDDSADQAEDQEDLSPSNRGITTRSRNKKDN